jgi:hypothetical protein
MGDDNSQIPRSRDPVPREVIRQTSGKRVGEPLVGLTQLTRRHDANGGRNETPSPVLGAGAAGEGPSQQRQQKERRYVAALRTGTPEYRISMPVRCSGTGVKNAFRKAGNLRSHADAQLASPGRIDRPSNLFGRQAPTLPAPDERRNRDIQVAAIGGAYGADRYHDDVVPRSRGRGGRVAAITVLAMVVLGSASTLAYRAVSGGFPGPLPIIKDSTGPNTIAQNNIEIERRSSSQRSIMSPRSSERRVSREQQPIDIREVPKTVPRVISAIPVSSPSDPPSTAPGSAAVALLAPAQADTASALDAPIASAVDSDVARSVPPLASAPISIPISPESKKTVAVAALAQEPADTAPALDAPAESAVDTGVARAVPLPVSAPVPITASSEPKNIQAVVIGPDGPVEGDSFSRSALSPDREIPSAVATPPVGNDDAKRAMASPSSRSHVRAARIAAGDASSGGYTVQLASERSVASAHTSFRVLRAKFANELGGREPIVRRVNLGVKGIYYRAMVGPFASMEEAAGMCKTLKAAGGKCVIQNY